MTTKLYQYPESKIRGYRRGDFTTVTTEQHVKVDWEPVVAVVVVLAAIVVALAYFGVL